MLTEDLDVVGITETWWDGKKQLDKLIPENHRGKVFFFKKNGSCS